MAGDEVGVAYEIGRVDGLGPEPQVRSGHGARLLRVVHEVALHEVVGRVDDDLGAVLVGADGAVRSQPEEHGLDFVGWPRRAEIPVPRKAERRHVVEDANGEVTLGPIAAQLVENGLGHGRCELLGRKPVAASDDPRPFAEGWFGVFHRLVYGDANVEIKRLAEGAGLLGPVEHGDRAHARRQGGDELLGRERPVEADGHHSHPLAVLDEGVDRFARSADSRAHEHYDPLGVGSAVILREAVGASGPLCERVHRCLHDPGDGQVIGIRRLARLEEHVGILRRAPHVGSVGVHSPTSELDYLVVVDERGHVLGREQGDLRQLVGGSKAVEEVEEGHARLQGGSVGDQGEVLGLLDRAGCQHGPTGRPGVHDVRVVAEDRQGMSCDGARGNMDHRRGQLPGDLEHVGHHQQQALRRGERRGQGALLQSTVEGARRAGFRLHLDDVGHLAPEVLSARCRPVVGELAHRRRRCDGVDRDHFRKGVGDTGSGLVAVDTNPLADVHAASLACRTTAPLSSPTVT